MKKSKNIYIFLLTLVLLSLKIFSTGLNLEKYSDLIFTDEDFLIRTRLWSPEPKKLLSININTASAYELSTFPYIDLETAEKIIAKRDQLGFFRSPAEYHGQVKALNKQF